MVWFEWESERVKRHKIFTECFGGNRRVLEGIQNFYCDNILAYCDNIQNFKAAAIKKELAVAYYDGNITFCGEN